MNNTLTTLSFSIYSNKSVYALLLGSGISRTSGIPTGWDVLMDLIKKLATQNKVTEELDDVAKWFLETYGEEPDYSILLDKLTKKSSERKELLRPYFEPTDEERENQLKTPTKAHHCIARLVKKGYIKVIVTTNFDRLMEKALENEGIIAQVIRNQDDIDRTTPLIHSPITIIKIHGDYLDCTFLNTKQELAEYPEKLNEYLNRIFKDFGIITCGWSAAWDNALIKVFERTKESRYNSFFTYVGNCEDSLSNLAKSRMGKY